MKTLASMRTLFPALALLTAATAHADLEYTIKPSLSSKSFFVRMVITNPGQTERVRIPAWCPGFYFLLDYEKRLYDFKAVDPDGNDLKAKRIDSRGFDINNPSGKPITISYRILGNDEGLGFFRSHLRQENGFINGASAFMFAENHMTEPVKVRFNMPSPDWDIATAMDTDGKGTYTANGYDELIDHPIQMGHFVRKKFTIGSIPYEVIWVGERIKCNIDEETERLRIGSIPALKLFGGASFKKYLYIVHLEIGDFNGGLEHRASNVIAVANTETIHLDDLATHEYFHAWNVKQIRPIILGPFDYTKEQRSPNIWFSEGVTDYYAQLHAYQAGFFTRSQLLDVYANKIEELQLGKTRLTMTLEEVCKKTWEDSGFGFGDMSYYTKGMLVGLICDAYLRGTTHGKTSLDDLMRAFYAKYQLPNPGFEDDAIKQKLIELSDPKIGPIYDQMVRSTTAMPYDLLKLIGLRLTIPGQMYTDPLYLTDVNGRVTNATISNLQGGIKDGDVILSSKLNATNQVLVQIRRHDKVMDLTLPGRTYKAGDYRLTANPFATAEEKQRLAEWLHIPN